MGQSSKDLRENYSRKRKEQFKDFKGGNELDVFRQQVAKSQYGWNIVSGERAALEELKYLRLKAITWTLAVITGRLKDPGK